MPLDQDIEGVPVLIHYPPQILALAFDGEKYLISLPLVSGSGGPTSELVSVLLAELATPFPYAS
jgi:hypothetical protein